ncbi:hypothetical protein, conserved [Trypanosoma brucei gambiense DAL972]|uniref:PP2A regulatory subunit B'' EF-hand domain-containing protein n=1 Tax=Trypanosoma brucei gambiense (strain MHOM/CI/86/DAL972) TaxID=679716 RepID=C9ZU36_TRYB9|nr:hypothetical protein, conserved [Trypanosoma brucei gambiense DAL972]CBH12922.1 hypothetical protein, conserved [Trypanosoma brucei gambiense DAL972]|eukprot:XP_011775201.1 hypothetical protein, conserved [Trypanosoma brucei gambiense DAL972]
MEPLQVMKNERVVSAWGTSPVDLRRGVGGESVATHDRVEHTVNGQGRSSSIRSALPGEFVSGEVSPLSYSSRWDLQRVQTPPSRGSSPEWRRGASYRTGADGNLFRGYSNVGSGVTSDFVSGEHGSDHCAYGSHMAEWEETGHPQDIGTKLGTYFRSGSAPVAGASSLHYTFYAPNSRAIGSNSGVAGQTSADVGGPADLPLLISASLTPQQINGVQSRMICANGQSQGGVGIKVLELLEYWMGEKSTAEVAEGLIAEFLQKAGIRYDASATPSKAGDEAFYLRETSPDDLEKVEVGSGTTPHGACGGRSGPPTSLSPSSGYFTLVNTDITRAAGEEEVEELQRDAGWDEGYEDRVKDAFEQSRVPNGPPQQPPVHSPPAQRSESVPLDATRLPTPPEAKDDGCASPNLFLRQRSGQPKDSTLRGASYRDIPPFYFPKGVPKTSEETLVGVTYTKHENPHLKVIEGMMIPAAACKNAAEQGAGANSRSATRGNKNVVIVSLRALEDKNVSLFVKRELSRIPMPPKAIQSSRPSVGPQVRGFCVSNGTLAKQGANYNDQLTQAMQRICTQCFGLPKYFAFMIMKILRATGDSDAMGMFAAPDVCSPLSRYSSAVTATCSSQAPITVQQVLDFFESSLRGRSIVRRVFELFLLSSSTGKHNCRSAVGAGSNCASTPHSASPRSYLLPEDFRGYLRILLDHHPGLALLKQTPDVQNRYMETVIYRIFYDLDRFNRGRITYAEMEDSALIDSLRQVDVADDINSVFHYFSYEHFYVLYCRFWELDTDRDMLLSRQDFVKYTPDGVMNPIIVDRIFNGLGRRSKSAVKDRINYEEFVWFCLSEEDKTTPTAVRYWFSILDLDCDGVLSLYELQRFYDETRRIILEHVPEGGIPFEDAVCQIFDMLGVTVSCGITLHDLLSNSEAAGAALNMLTNVVRLLQFEQKDPLVAHQDRLLCGLERTHWDRFARAEYDRMAQVAANE